MDLICDTNVWYDIAAGRRDPAALKRPGHRLLATPVSFIEIASELSDDTFAERSGAARAVVNHADEIALDTERHLAALWGLGVQPLTIDWMDAFKTVAMASNCKEVRDGVPDHAEHVIRKVRPEIAERARTHWPSFAAAMEVLVDRFFPGYLAARKRQRAKYASKERAKPFADAAKLPEIERYTALGTRARAALNLDSPPGEPTDEELVRVGGLLQPYVRAYARYVLNCATKYTPKPNDWGDLECFAYLQGHRRLLTRDERWLEVAAEANLGAWILDPEAKP